MVCRFIAPLFFILTIPAFAEAPGVPLKDAVPHMTTTGKAGADVVPDEAELNFAVVQERKTAEEATDATAKAAAMVIATARAQGVAAGELSTTFILSETFDAKNDERGVVSRVSRGRPAPTPMPSG